MPYSLVCTTRWCLLCKVRSHPAALDAASGSCLFVRRSLFNGTSARVARMISALGLSCASADLSARTSARDTRSHLLRTMRSANSICETRSCATLRSASESAASPPDSRAPNRSKRSAGDARSPLNAAASTTVTHVSRRATCSKVDAPRKDLTAAASSLASRGSKLEGSSDAPVKENRKIKNKK